MILFAAVNLLASDILAALNVLQNHPGVDSEKLGLWAISQGGWIAPIVAEQFKGLRCMAIVSGPSVSVGEENYYSSLTGDEEGEAPDDSVIEEIKRKVAAFTPSGFDPRPLLWELTVKTLWVHGGKDLSVPVDKCVRVLIP